MEEWLSENGLLCLLVLENAISTIRSFRKTKAEKQEAKQVSLEKKADRQAKALEKTVQKLEGE